MPRAALRIPHFRYLIAAMLFLATMINYLDRLAISVVSRDLRQEFGLTEQDYGQIIFFFRLAYASMYAASGPIIDRLGCAVFRLTLRALNGSRLRPGCPSRKSLADGLSAPGRSGGPDQLSALRLTAALYPSDAGRPPCSHTPHYYGWCSRPGPPAWSAARGPS